MVAFSDPWGERSSRRRFLLILRHWQPPRRPAGADQARLPATRSALRARR